MNKHHVTNNLRTSPEMLNTFAEFEDPENIKMNK